MNIIKKVRSDGISLRGAHTLMILATIVIMCFLLVDTFRAAYLYSEMTNATNDYIELEKSAEELMEASDHLTDRVQLFTVSGDPEDMNSYFTEVHTTRRRDAAIENISEISGESEAFKQIHTAMDRSNALMVTEIHAMRLICDAGDITDMPEEVAAVTLDAEETSLSNDEKVHLAQSMVHDEAYYKQKLGIRSSMENCLDALVNDTHSVQMSLNKQLHTKLIRIRVLLIIQSVAMIFVLWMTSYLGINPILKGVQRIKENRKIPLIGSYEFRYLAKTYNKMYEAFQKSIENLNYDASHDKLTGLYNRAGYDVLSAGIDITTTAVLLIDADKFKEVNDTYGHAVGDKVLRKIADTLKHTFRHEDYICRLGGDEFIVFMLHMDEERRELINLKTQLINRRLSDTSDGTPSVSVSVGVAFGKDEDSMKSFIKHADEALYSVKSSGRCSCAFYSHNEIAYI